ncbi:unnamed protein product [Paramecium sonneborni]|uniref:Uncharacterized protein n=1 Tax=Paramecium sonneborni TaxID=65129 RepID=A0A8S1L6Z0_9CILI|nr:unnamed protein product [Paramecium sonneborni]
MEQGLISASIQGNIKAPLRVLLISLILSIIVCFVEAIVFSVKTSEINQHCGSNSAAIVQAISYYFVLIALLVFVFVINRLKKTYILFTTIPCLILKTVSFIMMMTQLNYMWGTCYIEASQISTFIISDFFWIILILYYFSSLAKLQQRFPDVFYHSFKLNLLLGQ